MYYVYEFFIVETGEILYVGKGKGDRYKRRGCRNKSLKEMFKLYECDSRIVKYFENEKDAFQYEAEYMKQLKEQGQCICNLHPGGAGGSGEIWTDELRKSYSENNIMKDEKQRQRMSEHNPMKNKDVAKKAGALRQRPIIIGEEEYKSVKDASKKLNVTEPTVSGWLINGITSDGLLCHYQNSNSEIYYHINNGQPKIVVYKNIQYPSGCALAREIGVSQSAISSWCRKGRDPYGNSCRYIDDTRTSFNVKQQCIPVIVNNIWYPSKKAACKDLNLSSYTLTTYLDGRQYNPNYICKYDNQQPSQENVTESILEGSTTNE